MEEPGQEGAGSRCCNCRAVTKFCLLYYITLNLVVLVFAAVNQENLTRDQLYWFWGFLATIVFTVSLGIASLVLLIWVDHYVIVSEPEQKTSEVPKVEAANEKNDENSASFKTVLTINSSLPAPDRPEPPPQLQTLKPMTVDEPDTSGFVNLTPAVKSPVTLVDMKKGKLDRKVVRKTTERSMSKKTPRDYSTKLATEANLAVIPSDVLTKESKEKTNRAKHKLAKKKHKPKRKPSS